MHYVKKHQCEKTFVRITVKKPIKGHIGVGPESTFLTLSSYVKPFTHVLT